MSATSTLPAAGPVTAGTPGRPGLGGAVRWELRKLRAQRRTKAVLLGALLGPIPIALIIHAQGKPPKDTLMGRYATTNGFALALLVLGFAAQWVLPLLTAVVAGDIFAGEDQHGTWKTVLTRSASRAQLFVAKAVTAVGFAVLTLLILSTSTIVSSILVGGHQPLIGLSGQLVPSSTALQLVAASWLTTIPPTIGFACLAILLSVWSRNPAVGIATPVVIGMVMQLVGAMGGVEALRPYLLTTPYEAWHGLLAAPRFTGPLLEGLLTSGAWAAVTLAIAYALLRRRDITGG
ncbi:ABC transporter permease [Nocardioides panaciterrulae]|uniref:ABC-2 type transport system permease protein n=1 Tax=Nocardioides panaciterrulae TaxID=661492 RepID=A0A7Y9EAM3_9ACTN|nr:ABC transporter permease [Nocardioides panaciterrulae]NYD43910.1 ABC-2 type transport system permease protein [Nocardioides panaciterrulae]